MLLVEDDANDAFLTTRFLSRWRHPVTVDVAQNIEEAREKLNAGPQYALVLLDHNLPGGSGIDVLRTLRADGPNRNVPVVLLTGNSDGQVIAKAREAGVNSCVLKPVDPTDYEQNVCSIAEFWLGTNLIARRDDRAMAL